jgi:hypothetical protein
LKKDFVKFNILNQRDFRWLTESWPANTLSPQAIVKCWIDGGETHDGFFSPVVPSSA